MHGKDDAPGMDGMGGKNGGEGALGQCMLLPYLQGLQPLLVSHEGGDESCF